MSVINVPIPDIASLSQNGARLLQQSLAQAMQAADPASVSALDLDLARANTKALSFVQAVGLHGAYRYLRDFIARQAVPIFSSDKFLDGWLQTYKMARKEAKASQGSAAGTGVTDTVLPAGTLLQSGRGRQFRVLADATVDGGAITCNLIATIAGAGGDLAAGEALTLVSPIVGIDAEFTVAAGGLAGGVDREKDEEAVYRLGQRLANPPMGGCPADYARWALELPGITRAWGVRNPAGPTTAGVIIMADGNAPYGLPTEGQRTAVLDYIRDPRRGPPDELFVIIPTLQLVSPDIVLTPDTAATRAGTVAALRDLFLREAVPGGDIPHSHLIDVISDVAGEYNHQIVSPAITSGGVFVSTSYAHLLALGDVTFGA